MYPHILIIDDNPNIAQLIQRHLQQNNYSTDTATTYNDAKHKLQHHAYDLVTLDYHLDNGHTSLQLLPYIAQGTKTLLLSNISEHERQHIKDTHPRIHAHLCKTNIAEKLIPTIQHLIHTNKE